jgi:protein-S-isoprenylcysteine O-methyltransferase Ste14
MHRFQAAVKSSIFFLVAPGCVAGVIPYWLSGWHLEQPLHHWWPLRVGGSVLLISSTTVLVHAFARFVTEGAGTPAPLAPTERLVIGGVYRHVRNPMYLAVVGAIVGQSVILWQPGLLLYAALVLGAVASFVRFYEEPLLRRKYGVAYERYHHSVPGWWPRWHAWKPGS